MSYEDNYGERDHDLSEADIYARDTAAEEAEHLREQHADRMERFADPRPAKRIVATKAQWEQIRAAKDGPCRGCGGKRESFHHVIAKGAGNGGGDDVAANIIALCGSGTSGCHGAVQYKTPGWEVIANNVRLSLTPAELAYVRAKKGDWWLDKHLPLEREAA